VIILVTLPLVVGPPLRIIRSPVDPLLLALLPSRCRVFKGVVQLGEADPVGPAPGNGWSEVGMERTRLWGAHRFVTRFVNPVTSNVAGWAPGFGLVTHAGRTSGRSYTTPVNVFRDRDGFRFVLTYGSSANWVRNVLATGDCRLRTGNRTFRLVDPEVVTDPALRSFPAFVRLVGRMVGVTEFLVMRTDGPESCGPMGRSHADRWAGVMRTDGPDAGGSTATPTRRPTR
jgi:deazaflavin-dependent oxidoreductase (nitroreductase family)